MRRAIAEWLPDHPAMAASRSTATSRQAPTVTRSSTRTPADWASSSASASGALHLEVVPARSHVGLRRASNSGAVAPFSDHRTRARRTRRARASCKCLPGALRSTPWQRVLGPDATAASNHLRSGPSLASAVAPSKGVSARAVIGLTARTPHAVHGSWNTDQRPHNGEHRTIRLRTARRKNEVTIARHRSPGRGRCDCGGESFDLHERFIAGSRTRSRRTATRCPANTRFVTPPLLCFARTMVRNGQHGVHFTCFRPMRYCAPANEWQCGACGGLIAGELVSARRWELRAPEASTSEATQLLRVAHRVDAA